MRILKKVENSVLWLPKLPEIAVDNIRKEARIRLISEERIIFTHPLPLKTHIRAKQLADLALDTPSYCGHSTSLDGK